MSSRHGLSMSFYLRLMWRETRGSRGRFLFFVICLAIGVAAVVCVAGLTRNLDRRIRTEARQLLAADLKVSGTQRLSPEIETFFQQRPELEVTRVLDMIRDSAGDLLVELELFDIYRGENLGKSKKSLAFSLTFQSESSNLTALEVDALTGKIIRNLGSELDAQLRN